MNVNMTQVLFSADACMYLYITQYSLKAIRKLLAAFMHKNSRFPNIMKRRTVSLQQLLFLFCLSVSDLIYGCLISG